jgi:hypothetical protein
VRNNVIVVIRSLICSFFQSVFGSVFKSLIVKLIRRWKMHITGVREQR